VDTYCYGTHQNNNQTTQSNNNHIMESMFNFRNGPRTAAGRKKRSTKQQNQWVFRNVYFDGDEDIVADGSDSIVQVKQSFEHRKVGNVGYASHWVAKRGNPAPTRRSKSRISPVMNGITYVTNAAQQCSPPQQQQENQEDVYKRMYLELFGNEQLKKVELRKLKSNVGTGRSNISIHELIDL
jgi:hypothetical protein